PLTGVACPMTMATRITTATTGSSDRPGAKIFQIRNLPQDCGPLLLQMAERFGHSAPPFAERIIYARFSGSKKETCRILTFMSHTPDYTSEREPSPPGVYCQEPRKYSRIV